MFATGYVIGAVTGTLACLVTAALCRLIADLDRRAAVTPALVPLHVSSVSQASLN